MNGIPWDSNIIPVPAPAISPQDRSTGHVGPLKMDQRNRVSKTPPKSDHGTFSAYSISTLAVRSLSSTPPKPILTAGSWVRFLLLRIAHYTVTRLHILRWLCWRWRKLRGLMDSACRCLRQTPRISGPALYRSQLLVVVSSRTVQVPEVTAGSPANNEMAALEVLRRPHAPHYQEGASVFIGSFFVQAGSERDERAEAIVAAWSGWIGASSLRYQPRPT